MPGPTNVNFIAEQLQGSDHLCIVFTDQTVYDDIGTPPPDWTQGADNWEIHVQGTRTYHWSSPNDGEFVMISRAPCWVFKTQGIKSVTFSVACSTGSGSITKNVTVVATNPAGGPAKPPIAPQKVVSALPSDVPTGSTITVGPGGDFQAALNAAAALDQTLNHVIELTAGATFTGSFSTPAKTGPGWVTVRSSEWNQIAVASGTPSAAVYGARWGPINGNAHMATLCAPGGTSIQGTLFIPDGSNGWRFVGLEFKVHDDKNIYAFHFQPTYSVILVGGNLSQPNSCHSPLGPPIARRISFEKCWGHGLEFSQTNQVLTINGADVQVWDSRWEDAHMGAVPGGDALAQESQAIIMKDGPGPFHIERNFCSAAGQCIFTYAQFNSADVNLMSTVYDDPTYCIVSDVKILRNHCFIPIKWKNTDQGVKDPSWNGTHWVVKQVIEFKSGLQVLCEGNVLEGLWGQQGQAGQTPGFVAYYVRDVMYRSNLHVNCFACFYAGGTPSRARGTTQPDNPTPDKASYNDSWSFPPESLIRKRIAILNNLFLNAGRFSAFNTPVTEDLWIEHNTQTGTGDDPFWAWKFNLDNPTWNFNPGPGDRQIRFTMRNNIIGKQAFGFAADGKDNVQTDAGLELDKYFGTDRIMQRIAMIGGTQGNYNPAEFNLYPDAATAGLNADGTLQAGSPFKAGGVAGGTDNSDNGVNFPGLDAALMGGAITVPVAQFSVSQQAGTLTVQFQDASA